MLIQLLLRRGTELLTQLVVPELALLLLHEIHEWPCDGWWVGLQIREVLVELLDHCGLAQDVGEGHLTREGW